MAFGGSKQNKQQNDGPSQSAYLNMSEGDRIVRVLDQDETEYWAYWLNGKDWSNCGKGKSIIVGRDGPLRRHFEELGKDHPSYRKVGKKYVINVLDRTPVKKTLKGLPVYKLPNGSFPNDVNGESVVNSPIVPNNTVYIMNYGAQISDYFSVFHNKVNNRKTYQPMAMWEFDLIITRKGVELATTYMAYPGDDQEELPDELLSLKKYDLSQVTRPFPAEAQERLIAGEDYMEIMKSLGWDRPVATVEQLPF